MISAVLDSTSVTNRAVHYFRLAADEGTASVDRMMAWLLCFEWLGLVLLAFVNGPYTWQGAARHWNVHFVTALLSGPALFLPSIALTLLYPARRLTRHSVAVAQMLASSLLIGATGGRIETHFHVFGSLAFLAFYRDWKVLVTASAVAAIDHVARGIWWPISIYGISAVDPFRWLEHVWWVVFEDFFLFLAIHKGNAESKQLAHGKSLLYEGAYHDVLTGLANRRLLAQQFELSMKGDPAEPKAVLFIDLDRFKQANDLHGHIVGDKLLVEVATRLTACLSPETLLARIGGDEFVAFLPRLQQVDATRVGSRFLEALAATFMIDGHELLLSATVGISFYPEHGASLVGLLECGDQAMYSAKANGRNQVAVFSNADSAKKSRIEDLARDLFDALTKRQFQLNFQPIISKSGEVSSFEALIRWTHPLHGAIPPAEFIPLAERSGMIVAIGDWVLGEACRECRSWQKANSTPLRVAVNVSAVQFERQGFPSRVKEILAEARLHPALLTLELTESVLIRDTTTARYHLDDLRSIGVNISLDDFGTGYSSLSYLSELPADSLKLDRSFVQREFGKRSSVVESIVEMAHRIGLRVIAEGVESQEEADWLLNLKCDELQGYKFSRPIPAVLVLQYLASRLQPSTPFHEVEECAAVA